MAECERKEIKPELIKYLLWFEGWKYDVKVYGDGGIQFNVLDKDGITQTFYPGNGTILLHASNDRNNRKTETLRDRGLSDFIHLLNNPDVIQKIIRRKYTH